MDNAAETIVFKCECGTETHAFVETGESCVKLQNVEIRCWACGEVIAHPEAERVWTASTAQGARSLRIIDA